jgi:hypothetical protein
MMKGDGTVTSSGCKKFTQKCKKMVDGFQMLCAMIGRRTNCRPKTLHRNGTVYSIHDITVYKSPRMHTPGLKISEERYEGRVWCPTTKNGTWMARRNGITFWTGNSNLTRFEKAVPRRLVPFYGWLKQSTGAVLEELAARPGGKAGVAVRAGSDMRGQDPGFIPDYLGGGVVAKVGSPDETGTQRFLTSLGLPIEDLGQTLGGGLSGLLGNLNPLIKLPIEQATGKQLHTGRDLADLHSMSSELLGQPLPFLENALMNSPFGRVATTARTLMDERKDPLTRAINVGTGLRFSDIDMDKAKLVATRDYIENALRGAPGVSHFERMYVRPDQYQNLSPWEIELLRLNATMDRRAAAARRP